MADPNHAIVRQATNLHHLQEELELIGPETEDVRTVLHNSEDGWLNFQAWELLFTSLRFLPESNSLTIPEGEDQEGLYRVDNRWNEDRNHQLWLQTNGRRTINGGDHYFDVRIARSRYLYHMNGVRVEPDEGVNTGLRQIRHTVRDSRRHRGIAFVHYRYEWRQNWNMFN